MASLNEPWSQTDRYLGAHGPGAGFFLLGAKWGFEATQPRTPQRRRGARPGTGFIPLSPSRNCPLPAAAACHERTRDLRPPLLPRIGALAVAAPVTSSADSMALAEVGTVVDYSLKINASSAYSGHRSTQAEFAYTSC